MITKLLTYIFIFLFTFTSSAYPRFTDAYTDGLWINGVDSNLGTWTAGIENPFYVKQNTSDFAKVRNRDDFILEALIIGSYYVGVSYFAGDGDIIEGNKRMKDTDAYKYTFGAVNDATGYVVGKGIEGTDYLLNKTGITDSKYYLSEQIGKGLKWYENNISEETRNYIGYVGDVTNVAIIGASATKIVDTAVNKTLSATKSIGNKINKSIDKTVDGMTIDFGDTLPKTNVNINSFDNILKDASLSVKQTSLKKVINYEKGGNAYKDFASINAVNPQVKNNTFIGKTKDGEIINLHKSTSLNGIETLEVYDNNINRYIDIRYK